jgi:hypothetical protein
MHRDQNGAQQPALVNFAAMTKEALPEQVSSDLSILAFWNDGFKSALKRITKSKRSYSTLLDDIASLLQETKAEVDAAVGRLREARKHLPDKVGMEITHQVDEVIEAKVGPGKIRDKLAELAQSNHTPKSQGTRTSCRD